MGGNEARIDLTEALDKIDCLGHGVYDHFIGFRNYPTREMVQFVHYAEINWYADVPICQDGNEHHWDGYVLGVPYG